MKRIAIVLMLTFATLAGAQTDNTLYVKQFPGLDVGAKVENAQSSCNPNTVIPCILVIDPSLAVYAPGIMPTLCSQCTLMDYRLPGSGTVVAGNAILSSINGIVRAGNAVFSSINGLVMADQQSGIDMCAKIINAEAVPGARIIDATHFSGNQSCASDPLANLTSNMTLRLGNVYISSTHTWHIVANGARVIGEGISQTILAYTGSAGPYIMLIGGPTSPSQVFGVEVADIGIAGNNATTDGILAQWSQHMKLSNISGWGVTGALIHTQASILGTYIDDSASLGDAENVLGYNSGTAQTFAPASLFNFDILSSIQTTAGTVITPIAENLTGCAINLTSASSMTITSGTTETDTGWGVCVGAASTYNTIIGLDSEANTLGDVKDLGTSTKLLNIIAISSPGYVTLDSTSNGAEISGGSVSNVLGSTTNNYTWTKANGSVRSLHAWAGGDNSTSIGWNAITGSAEADYYQNVYTGGETHSFFRANSTNSGYSYQGGFNASDRFSTNGGFAVNSNTVIPSTALGYRGPAAGYVLSGISGSVALVSGTATVSTTAACTVGTNCNYSLTRCAANSSTGIGSLSVGTITAGTGFVINSLSTVGAVLTTDASTVCWQIN